MVSLRLLLASAASISLLSLFPTPVRAQSEAERLEKLERAVELLQKRNTELEQEVRSLKGKPPAPAAKAESPTAQPPNDGKSFVEKAPAKEEKRGVNAVAGASEFKLTLSGYIQAQVEAGDVLAFEGRFARGTGEIKDRFRVRRGRVTIAGDYTENFDFKAEGEFSLSDSALTVRDATGRTLANNSSRTGFAGTDIFVNWHTFPEFNIRAGQWKAPFGLEQLTPDPKLLTPERTLVTTALTPERQIGAMVWGKPFTNIWPEQKELLTYFAGVFNGTGRNTTVNDNNEFMYVGRIEVQALRSKILNQDATLRFGANGLTSRDETGTTVSPQVLEANEGSLAGFNLPSRGTREAYGVDAALHIGPFDLSAEYIDERFNSRGPAPLFNAFEPDGYYVMASYFVLPKKLQLLAKWESFDPDQANDDDIHSITAGLNYYIKGDDIKILANYIHTWSDFRESRAGASEFNEVIVRLQVMF